MVEFLNRELAPHAPKADGVGREHYALASRYFVGSADLMNRNLDKRVETLVQIDDPALQARVEEILTVNLSPNRLAWTLEPDGTWSQLESSASTSHERFQRLARERSHSAPT